ncbi:MAG: pyridoxamine 5'-phosphate oxidase family protein [Caldimonas sp.]
MDSIAEHPERNREDLVHRRVDDPHITAIRVRPSGGYYWDNKHGNAIAGIKMMIGTVIGKTLDDCIEGTVTV